MVAGGGRGVAPSCACVASSHSPAYIGWSSRSSGAPLVRVRVRVRVKARVRVIVRVREGQG